MSVVRLVFLVRLVSAVVESKAEIAIQSTQFIFLVLEPHCSIIAGCLPCYKPFIRPGGRDPESMVRSVRPISWGSGGSGGSRGSKSRTRKGERFQTPGPKDGESRGERQVELSNRSQWPESSYDVHISRGSRKSNSSMGSRDKGAPANPPPEAVHVTRGVEVSYV
ncbi:hypothetical protein DL771_010651 [Monosporascus sp. 5C6A]|nr:hypothetical protein DL771_010651 [Monosporascus sp. 5C6A]